MKNACHTTGGTTRATLVLNLLSPESWLKDLAASERHMLLRISHHVGRKWVQIFTVSLVI